MVSRFCGTSSFTVAGFQEKELARSYLDGRPLWVLRATPSTFLAQAALAPVRGRRRARALLRGPLTGEAVKHLSIRVTGRRARIEEGAHSHFDEL